MKSYNYISLLAAAFLFGLLAFSCSDESPVVETSGSQDVKFQVKISDGVSVHTGSRVGGEDESSIFDRFPVGFDFIEGRSLINVCSVDRSPGSKNYEPDYNYAYTIAEKDLHPTRYHQYICKTKREYEEYSDFVSYGDAVPLQWDKVNEETGERIENSGNILRTNTDGGFYLFAAMYPYTYTRPIKNGENVLSVKSNQTYNINDYNEYGHFAANLLLNDIRLCQKMYGYDHFRMPIQLDFFHSLCMLVVNVKVPLYKETDGLGFYKTDVLNINNPPTMSINSVALHYKPNYGIAYDKDDAVSVNAVLDDKEDLENINMFHTPNFSNPDKTNPLNFKIEDYYYETTEEYEGEEVPVLWMQYCVILPFQQLTDTNTDANILFTVAGKKYRCHFSKISEPVKLQQGHVTIVSMYIPRGESDPILIGARLKTWERKRTPIISLQ